MREENPKKVLFLVHREQIAKQAMTSYKRVFGNTKTFGLLSGNSKDYDADYLFATRQMMAKDEALTHFRPDTFGTIIIDETHRIGSASYQKILNYFHPKFLLGMSATPERTDGYMVSISSLITILPMRSVCSRRWRKICCVRSIILASRIW